MKILISSFVSILLFISIALLKERKGFEKVFERNEAEESENEDYFYQQRSFPYGKIDYDAQRNAAVAFKTAQNSGIRDLTEWEFAGPVNIGGRIVDVEFDPTNPQIAYFAAASGGVFKSTDWLGSWTPLFDEQTTLSMGDIAIAPSDPKIIYVGTGEANGGSGSLTYDANGVYKSTDGGITWNNVGLNNTRLTGRIAIHPTDPDIVFAATMGDLYGNTPDRGLYKTTDGGITWNQVLFVTDSTGVIDVVINPQNPNIVFATTWTRTRHANTKDYAGVESGVWKSTDGGDTFVRLDEINGLPPVGMEYSRIGIDICASSPNVVYCMYIGEDYDFHGLYKSTDDGNTWEETNDATLFGTMSNQGYWYGRVKCDPTNPDILYVIGFDMYKTTNGGNSYQPTFNYTHVDQHAVAVHPLDHEYVLLGNDGGLHASHDGGLSWSSATVLPVSQIYRVGIDPANSESLYCGLQDNGTSFTGSGAVNDYAFLFGGDGFQALVHPLDNNILLVGYQYGNIFKSTDGGYWFDYSTYPDVYGTANWNYPLTPDPHNADVVYTGTQSIFRSDDFGSSWYNFSSDLTQLDQTGTLIYGTITFIDVSPLNSDIIYAGTDDGKVWNTLNGGTTWQEVDAGLPIRWVTCVETDPFDESTAYVTISGYRFHDNMNHVYMTNDNGQSWIDIGSNLPDVPCSCIIADPSVPNALYLATDVGVYYSLNGGASWETTGTGMPIVPCVDLKLHQPSRTLVVGTYGRSMYKMNVDQLIGVQPIAETEFSFSVFPNPVIDDAVVISMSVPQSLAATIALIAMNGKTVRQQDLSMSKGSQAFKFDMKDVAPGIYFLQFKQGDYSASQKIVVQ